MTPFSLRAVHVSNLDDKDEDCIRAANVPAYVAFLPDLVVCGGCASPRLRQFLIFQLLLKAAAIRELAGIGPPDSLSFWQIRQQERFASRLCARSSDHRASAGNGVIQHRKFGGYSQSARLP
jgi:hypothetical protein